MNPNRLRKRERKLKRRLERAHESGNMQDVREARRAYMRSAAARGVAALDANKSLPAHRRVTDAKALETGASIRWGKRIQEKVRRTQLEKPNGGTREICDFGLKERTAQRVLRRVLSPEFKPQPWQYEFRTGGTSRAILDAKANILAGRTWGAELDVQDFFQSFDESALEIVPLSRKVARHHVLAPSSVSHTTPTVVGQKPATRPGGLPQGSSLSPLIAQSMIARLQLGPEIVALNWADNFLVLAGSKEQAIAHVHALQAAIAALPGEFRTKVKSVSDAREGVCFLGHLLVQIDSGVTIAPTQKRHEAFYQRLTDFQARTNHALAKGDKAKARTVLAAMWRFARGWCAAMRACDDVGDYLEQVRAEIADHLPTLCS